MIYCSLGQFKEALNYSQESLKIAETSFGKGHGDYGDSLLNIVSVYNSFGQYQEALRILEEAFNISFIYGCRNAQYTEFLKTVKCSFLETNNFEYVLNKLSEG